MIENAGAFVVSDRFCFGSTPGREVIELNDEEDVLTQICAHYLKVTQCPRYMSQEKIQERRDFSNYLATEYKAEGIIYEAMKFCDFWAFERTLVSHIMNEEYNWPVLSIDRPYMARGSGQLRTRLQAFVESLEIKQIQKAAKEG
jgi:benzoyl-CoA reductase/2-hydroxyglutaryl-CoA dehydratase subunit BcrC/BadD/HgdB